VSRDYAQAAVLMAKAEAKRRRTMTMMRDACQIETYYIYYLLSTMKQKRKVTSKCYRTYDDNVKLKDLGKASPQSKQNN